jgi:cytoskeletal protein CcmA (bactofilin family)
MSTGAGFALLALAGVAMLVLPFVPAWREWTRPTDCVALAVPAGYTSEVEYFARQVRERMAAQAAPAEKGLRLDGPVRFDAPLHVSGDVETARGASFAALLSTGDIRLGPASEVTHWVHADGNLTLGEDSLVLRRATCGGVLEVGDGVSFERLHARTIVFGRHDAARSAASAPAAATPLDALPHVTRRSAGHFRAAGDLALPAHSRFEGSLVVTGALAIGENTTFAGDVKAHDGLVVGAGARVAGALTCERNIHVLEGARVNGPVVSETDVWLAPGVEIGAADSPTTVTAENIIVGAGAIAHGTLWARDAGVVWSA